MTIARGSGPTYITVTAGTSNTGVISTTTGRSLVAAVIWYETQSANPPTIGVNGESNMTYIAGSKFSNPSVNGSAGQIAYLANITSGGSKTITADFGAPGNYCDVAVMEYSGMNTGSQPDNSTSATGTTTATTSLTTLTDNALIVACGVNNSTEFTAGSGFILFGGGGMPNTIYNEESEDEVDAAGAAAKTVAFVGVVANFGMTVASFKAGAPPPSGTAQSIFTNFPKFFMCQPLRQGRRL